MRKTIKIISLCIAVFICHNSFAQLQEVLMLTVSSGSNSDQTAIRFLDEATDSFDSQYDAYKWDNPGNTPNIFTVSDESYAINSLSKNFEEKTISLYFKAGFTGSYILKSEEIGAFNSTWSITLMDKKTDTELNLRSNGDYTFDAQKEDLSNRFTLQFKIEPQLVTSVEETKTADEMIYASGENILIQMGNQSGTVFITNMLGNEILNVEVPSGNGSVWSFRPGITGLYIVNLLRDNKHYYKKVYVGSTVIL